MRMQEKIEQILQEGLQPLHLEVVDESHMHSVPADAQSHFKVTVVTAGFEGQSLLQRHRAVNRTLQENGVMDAIHALALHTLTPDEWYARGGQAPESPPCLGGSKA
ncbi:MAG: BolA/IbaG family iron-sulfur metabolism protein [Gammaproteobacteria bacterium]|nr:MAG: BolA/IbaG family iron-sulfur metabolism protein [Gammaproteobacteria bacterium]